jgi:hypothetical protein
METDRPIAPHCECKEGTGVNGCTSYAQWLVGIGGRAFDRQLSCGRHLNRTCWLMIEADKPRTATLTVTALGSWQERAIESGELAGRTL